VDNDKFSLNPKVYDFIKWIALVVLPAASVFVITLGLILQWNQAQVVAAVLTALDTFLGALLKKSATNYKAQNTLGDLVILQRPDGAADGMKIVGTVENPVFQDGGQVLLNVKREQKLE
jgi:hypothetical protein